MSWLSKFAAAFPRNANLFNRIDTSTTPLRTLRKEIFESRVEYWVRKLQGYPEVWNGAKAELKALPDILSSPASWTVRHVVVVGIFGIQVYGCFKLGEISARKTIAGYPTDNINPDLFKAKH